MLKILPQAGGLWCVSGPLSGPFTGPGLSRRSPGNADDSDLCETHLCHVTQDVILTLSSALYVNPAKHWLPEITFTTSRSRAFCRRQGNVKAARCPSHCLGGSREVIISDQISLVSLLSYWMGGRIKFRRNLKSSF